jgi:predicted ester cyclase
MIRRYREIYNANDLEALSEVPATDFIAHNLLPGVPTGIGGAKRAHQMTLSMFPDQHLRTEDLIAKGDRVVERWTLECTRMGTPFFIGNIPASGKKIRILGISTYRIEDGKVVEHWAQFDSIGLLQQVGAMQPPA